MKLTRLLLSAFAVILLLGTTAMADTTLTLTNGFLPGGCPAGGCASVGISVNGAANTATFTVSSLLAGYQFDTFGFNYTGGGTLSLFGTPTGAVSVASLSGLGNEDGFGKYLYNFNTGINGGSTGFACDGTAADSDCTFSFTVTGPTISGVSQFESLVNGSNQGDSLTWFAGHLASSPCTGYVGGGGDATSRPSDTGTCTPTDVPEPASMQLLGVGGLLSSLGLAVRLKLRR
jgi:hypothetical protein